MNAPDIRIEEVAERQTQSDAGDSILPWFDQYFRDNFYASPGLNSKDWEPILHFALVWNLFETNVCHKNANLNALKRSVESFSEPLDMTRYRDCFEFFQNRYSESDGARYRFDTLFPNPRGSDIEMKLHLSRVFLSDDAAASDIILGLLYIAYRIRNNFFHGNKSLGLILGQTELFRNVNQILIRYMDDVRNADAGETRNLSSSRRLL